MIVLHLVGKQVMHIACGDSYSAAVTANGELYTWGRGNYGRLGHDNNDDQSVPLLLSSLKGQRVIDVSCGSSDAQTLAVTDAGNQSIILNTFSLYLQSPTLINKPSM